MYSKYKHYCLEAAELKSVIGNYNFGLINLNPPQNSEIKQDIQKGIMHLSISAKEGHSLSQIALGLLYLDGSQHY